MTQVAGRTFEVAVAVVLAPDIDKDKRVLDDLEGTTVHARVDPGLNQGEAEEARSVLRVARTAS